MGKTAKSTTLHYVKKTYVKMGSAFGDMTHISQGFQNIRKQRNSLKRWQKS